VAGVKLLRGKEDPKAPGMVEELFPVDELKLLGIVVAFPENDVPVPPGIAPALPPVDVPKPFGMAAALPAADEFRGVVERPVASYGLAVTALGFVPQLGVVEPFFDKPGEVEEFPLQGQLDSQPDSMIPAKNRPVMAILGILPIGFPLLDLCFNESDNGLPTVLPSPPRPRFRRADLPKVGGL
jgi:hypothetical protein